ncbi:MAG: hypothetical protein R3B40_01725 [Polyangiales bacterium]
MTLLLTTVQLRSASFAANEQAQTAEDVYYLPADEGVLAVLTLGYREAVADLLWMRALLYYNESLRQTTGADFTLNYASALSALDPHFAPVYTWAGMVPFYLRVSTDHETQRRAVAYMVTGSDRLPEDGQLAWDTASTILYELLPVFQGTDEERQAWRRTAARLSERALRLGAGPPWLAMDAGSLLSQLGESDRAVRVIEQRIALTNDPTERADLNVRLQRLRAGAEAVLAEAEARAHEAARARDYPYLDLDRYLVVGTRRMPADGPRRDP